MIVPNVVPRPPALPPAQQTDRSSYIPPRDREEENSLDRYTLTTVRSRVPWATGGRAPRTSESFQHCSRAHVSRTLRSACPKCSNVHTGLRPFSSQFMAHKTAPAHNPSGSTKMAMLLRHAAADNRESCTLMCSEGPHWPWQARHGARKRPHHRLAWISPSLHLPRSRLISLR